jgi:HSP20 family protein
MALTRWEPHRFLGPLRREVDKVFDDFFTGWPSLPRRRRGEEEAEFIEPAIEVAETDEAVVVKAQVPGIQKDQLEVEITADGLTLKGEVKEEKEEKKKNYHHREIRYGAFLRTVSFPVAVENEKAKATLKDGVLQITIPKSAPSKSKSVKVEVA